MRDRGTDDERNAIAKLIISTEATVVNINTGNDYIDEIHN